MPVAAETLHSAGLEGSQSAGTKVGLDVGELAMAGCPVGVCETASAGSHL
jgi:hypothetical protein